MIKAVIIGCAHMHVNEVALYIHEQSDMVLTAFCDTKPAVEDLPDTRYTRRWNINNIKTNYCKNYYSEIGEMLDTEKPDIAFILCETAQKLSVVKECAGRKIFMSIEKPLAMNIEEATAIKAECEKNNVGFMVNWPLTWRPYLHRMKAALDSGLIGDLIKIRFLIGNTGPVGRGAAHRGVNKAAEEMSDREKASMWWYQKKCGGGALLDFCCYGCMLAGWFTGENAISVTAAAGNYATDFSDVYDNAVALVKYNGSFAVLEGTWTTPSAAIPAGPMIFGRDGVLYCEKTENGIVVKAIDIYGNELPVPEYESPEYMKNIAEMYVYSKKTNGTIHKTLTSDFNMSVMATLDAAVKSAESGKTIVLGD